MSDRMQDIQEALNKIIQKEGLSCLKNSSKFRGMWMDYVSQSSESKLILTAVQEGVGSLLINALDQNETEQGHILNQCVKKLTDAYISDDAAKLAIRELASAVGIPADRLMSAEAESSESSGKRLNVLRSSNPTKQKNKTPAKNDKNENNKDSLSDEPVENHVINQPAFEEQTPQKKKKKSKLWMLLLLLICGAAVGVFLSGGAEEVPDNALLPTVVPSDQEEENLADAPAVMPPVVPEADEPEEETPEEIPVVVPDISESDPGETQYGYQIDTVASNLYNFHGMVMTNTNNIFYMNNNVISDTETHGSLDIISDLGLDGRKTVYLAQDPQRDIVYLAGNTENEGTVIYDITDLKDPKLVLNQQICTALIESECGRLTGWGEYVTTMNEIPVLENGALLLPFTSMHHSNQVHMVNIDSLTITPIPNCYSAKYRKLVGNYLISMGADATDFLISELGSEETNTIDIEMKTPPHVGALYSKYGKLYGYLDEVGICEYYTDGSVNVLVPKESIKVKDYQSIDITDIEAVAVGSEDSIALYDESLGCIRLIQPNIIAE